MSNCWYRLRTKVVAYIILICKIPSSSSLSRYSFVLRFSETSLPSTSVSLFLDIVRPLRELLFWTLEMRTFIKENIYFDLRRSKIHTWGRKLQISSVCVQIINHMTKFSTQSVWLLLLLSSASLLLLTTTKLKHFLLFFHLLQCPFFPLLLLFYFSHLFLHLALLSLFLFFYSSHFQNSVCVWLNNIINLLRSRLSLIHYSKN